MTLDASGNLGVGATSLSVKLQVSKSGAGIQDIAWLNNSQAVGTDVGSQLSFTGTTNNNGLAAIGGAFAGATTADGGYMFFSTRAVTSGTLTERARITSGGNFLIGDFTAESKLNVYSGGGTFSSGTMPAGMTIYGNTNNGQGSMLSFKANSGDQGIAGIAGVRSSGYETELRFYTNNTSSQNAFTERVRIGSGGEVYFPGVGTTASAANAYLNNGSTPANQLLRSTSSLRYKTDVETLDHAKADAVLNLRPVWYRSKAEADRKDWSWYGLIAEEVAQVEPRLVHWSYPEDQFETIETQTEIEKTREVEVTPAVLDDEGNVVEPAVTETETYTETETKSERKLKADAQLAPDGVQYDRLTVMLLDIVKRQNQRIEQLEAKVAALEAQ